MTKLIVLGDSIMRGFSWDDKGQVMMNPAIPEMIGKQLGWQVNNQAVNATKYYDDGKGNNFTDMVKKFNFKDYDKVLLGYGINDFDDSPWPDPWSVRQSMRKGIAKIKQDNPSIRIYVEVPTQSFQKGNTLDSPNESGYTQRQIDDAIADEARFNDLAVFDWRTEAPNLISADNKSTTIGPWGVHPKTWVATEMARLLADWLKKVDAGGGSMGITWRPPEINWVTIGDEQTGTASTIQKIDPIKLERIKNYEQSNDVFNANLKKIWTALMAIEGEVEETGWTPRSFDGFNRAFRNYVFKAIQLIRSYIIYHLGTTTIEDNGVDIAVETYQISESLMIDDFINSLNGFFDTSEKCINFIINSMY